MITEADIHVDAETTARLWDLETMRKPPVLPEQTPCPLWAKARHEIFIKQARLDRDNMAEETRLAKLAELQRSEEERLAKAQAMRAQERLELAQREKERINAERQHAREARERAKPTLHFDRAF